MSSSAALVLHCGGRYVAREDLDQVEAPPATKTWFPVPHRDVLDATVQTLKEAGFDAQVLRLGLSRGDHRFFGVLALRAAVGDGVDLAVGVRNSTDKSLPIAFCAGHRVFVCDNLAFSSEIVVRRKHTRFGATRFLEAMTRAVAGLPAFREAEAARVRRLQATAVSDERAEAAMLRSYERGLVSHVALRAVLREWRAPSFEAFRPRTLWSLFNAFTSVLRDRERSNPQQFVATTIRLQQSLDEAATNAASQALESSTLDPTAATTFAAVG